MNGGGDVLAHAPKAARQAILAEYLAWLANPAHQPRQVQQTLFGPRDGQCCALGALGLILEQHGYARREGRTLQVSLDALSSGGPLVHFHSETQLPLEALSPLGLGHAHNVIAHFNDHSGRTFAQIGDYLRGCQPTVPDDQAPADQGGAG